MDINLILDTLQQALQREKIIRENICQIYEHENLHARINFHEELIKNIEHLIKNDKFSPNEHSKHIKEIEDENKLIKSLLDENLKLLQNIMKHNKIIENIQKSIDEIKKF